MKTHINFPAILVALLLLAAGAFGQMVKMDAFQIRRSALVEQIKGLRAANAKMTAVEFAEAANALIDKNGLPFSFSFDAATCERLRKLKAQQKDANAPLRLGATLKSVEAEGASLALPEPSFSPVECGDCFIELPVLQVTPRDFVTIIGGRNIKFQLPGNFITHEAVLLDAKDQSTVKRKWKIPFRTTPIGVSHDENVLYLGFEEPELAELSLLVFGEGVFQIGTRADAENGGKGKLVETPGAVGLDRRIKFERWGNVYLIAYKDVCK